MDSFLCLCLVVSADAELHKCAFSQRASELLYILHKELNVRLFLRLAIRA